MKKINIRDLPLLGVSHNPEVKKKTIITKGEIPHLMMYGQAIFKPGQKTDLHKHKTMYEVFCIQSGRAVFKIGNKEYLAKKNDVVVIEPGELHSQTNPYGEDLTWLYFGISTE